MENDQSLPEARGGSGSSSAQSSGERTFLFTCPYLGTLDDPETAMSYPAAGNHCYRLRSPASVELTHQEAFCLSERHTSCAIFKQAVGTSEEPRPAAEPASTAAAPEPKQKQRVSLLALPLVLLLLLAAAIIWWPEPGATIQEALVRGAVLPGAQSEASLNEPAPDPAAAVQAAAEVAAVEEPAAQAAPSDQSPADEPAGSNGFPVVPSADGQEAPAAAAPAEAPTEAPAPTATAVPAAAPPTVAPEPTSAPEDAAEVGSEATQSDSAENADAAEAAAAEEVVEAAEVPSEEPVEAVTDAPEAVEEAAPASDVVQTGSSDTPEAADSAEEIAAEEEDIFTVYDIPVVGSAGSSAPVPAPAPAPAAGSSAGTFEQTIFVGPDGESLPALQSGRQQNEALFVRSSPSDESNLLALIDRRQQVTLLGRDESSQWLKIRLSSGVEGWVSAAQSRAGINAGNLPLAGGSVASTAPAPVRAPVQSALPLAGTALVNSGAINVRSGPGVEYEPLTIVYGGREIGLLGRQTRGVWARVRLLDSGVEGWVNSTLLVPVGQILSLPAVP